MSTEVYEITEIGKAETYLSAYIARRQSKR